MDVTLTQLSAEGAHLAFLLPVTMCTAAALGILVLLLSGRISQLRLKNGVSLGDGGIKPLARAVRAHGNTLEYAPLVLIMLALFELAGGHDLLLLVSAVAFVIARYLYAWGLLTRSFTRRRQLGTLVTYVVILVLSVALVVKALPALGA